MNGSVRMGHVLGVPLRIHWTVPLLVVLFGYSLGSHTLPAEVPDRPSVMYSVVGLVGALLLLAGLLAHEVALAITARRKGIDVQSITLWALGGMTEMGRPRAAAATFLVAVSGRLTSFVIGACALGAGIGLDAGFGWALAAAVLIWLGWVIVVLGVFNLLPTAPFDGGRVVQALMWWRTGDQERAERAAARGRHILGMPLIALGWVAVLGGVFGGLRPATLVALLLSRPKRRPRALTYDPERGHHPPLEKYEPRVSRANPGSRAQENRRSKQPRDPSLHERKAMVMDCYECAQQDRAVAAVAVCRVCGAGVCADHVRSESKILRGSAQPGKVIHDRPARQLTCPVCRAAEESP